jgi:hypothetical protein
MRLSHGMILGIALVLSLGACANAGLRELRSGSKGPDEFLIVPVKPLQTPTNLASLPAPTPGGSNLTDPQPQNDAIVAMGGRVQSGGAIPGTDGAMVNYVSRFGVTGEIRTTLATEDAAFRKQKSRFTQYRLVPVDRYNQAYERFAIDPYRVTEGFRQIGVKTPSSPP